jgi:hypothetical protein
MPDQQYQTNWCKQERSSKAYDENFITARKIFITIDLLMLCKWKNLAQNWASDIFITSKSQLAVTLYVTFCTDYI